MKKAFTAIAAAFTLTGAITGNSFAAEYNVKKGDSLWSISKNQHTTVDSLMEWNHLKSDLIYPKQKLIVVNKEVYEAKNGDTIWDIAQKYNVTVDQIKKWNHLSSTIIHPNDELVVYPEEDSKVEKESTVEKTADKVESSSAKSTNEAAKPAKTEKKTTVTKAANKNSVDHVKKEVQVRATAYTANCAKCSGITATGVNIKKHPEKKVISVDPKVIPLGSKVYVEGYGYATAADTGGAIKGHRIDIFIPELADAKKWGVRSVKVKIVD